MEEDDEFTVEEGQIVNRMESLESAVISAAIAWRRLDVEVREVGDHFELDPLRESVDALIKAREEKK